MKKMDVATANHDQVCSLKLVNDVFFECRLASQTHRSYSRIFYPPNSAKLNKSFKILFTKDYGLLPYSKELLNIHYLLLLSTLPCPLFREFGEYLAPDRRADMSNTTFFTPIPIPNISKEALTIPNTNTNFLKEP